MTKRVAVAKVWNQLGRRQQEEILERYGLLDGTIPPWVTVEISCANKRSTRPNPERFEGNGESESLSISITPIWKALIYPFNHPKTLSQKLTFI